MPAPPTRPPSHAWQGLVDLALIEDIGPGDLTSNVVIPAAATAEARIEARQPLTVAGLFVAEAVFSQVDPELEIERATREGEVVDAGVVLMRVSGSLRALLTAERTALNFLQRMCGVATQTAGYVAETEGTRAEVVDTRKTLPGWRALDKFAVAAGGGTNHRHALYDGILLKDNHLAGVGGVSAALEVALRDAPANIRVQVEVESLADAQLAVKAGADFLLLDNCSPDEVREIVEALGDRVTLEATGGIHLGNLRAYAETGIHRISMGALTHSVPAADIALELEPSGG